MTTPKRLVEEALKTVGMTEKPAGSNRQPFAAEAGHANGAPWCASWVVAMLKRAGATKLVCAGAYTPTHANEAKKQGRVVSVADARAGDILLVDFPPKQRIQHIGIILENRGGGKLLTVEGNTSGSGSQANGGAVLKKERDMNKMAAHVIYRPYFTGDDSAAGLGSGTGRPDDTIAMRGDSNPTVIIVQKQLNAFAGADLVPDGEFGPATEAAVKAFQKAQGIDVTGRWTSVEGDRMVELGTKPNAPQMGAERVAEVVIIGGEGDRPAGELLADAIKAPLGTLDLRSPAGVAHLIGGPAIRGYDRELATKVVEHSGANREATLDGVTAYVKERTT